MLLQQKNQPMQSALDALHRLLPPSQRKVMEDAGTYSLSGTVTSKYSSL